MSTLPIPQIKVADEVWLTVLKLHEAQPEQPDFSIDEILEFAMNSALRRSMGSLRPSFYAHVVQHCVANRPPSPARYRMLLETGSGRRRLFRPGDPSNPQREGGKSVPMVFDDLPGCDFSGALKRYNEWCQKNARDSLANDPLLALFGSGKDLWADEDADEYIRRLREGWE